MYESSVHKPYDQRLTENNRVPPVHSIVSMWAPRDIAHNTHRKNILLINRSLFTDFLFLPFGTSVHIYSGLVTLVCLKVLGTCLLHVLEDL